MERYFDLYLNAGVSVPLVINANQYDKSETWLFTLYDETGIQFRPASGSIVGLKADGNTIVNAGTVNSSGQVVIQETEQITAVAGKNEYELILDASHGTANFVVLVERRPGDNAVPSESDISLISQAVQAASGIEAVLVLQNTVASLREEVNQWVAEHAGTTNETTLWEGDLDTDTPITLSHPATQYDVIAVYTNIANSDNSAVTPEAHYFRADEFKQGSVFISCGRADVETGASTEIVTETFRLITNTTGTTTTVSLDTRKQVRWNGQASSNAGITFPTMPSVVRITGIKTVQDDQEIINARVGKNGTQYNTLKARLDAETAIVDSSLTVSGAAADAKKTGEEISDLKSQISDIEEQIEGGTGSGLTDQAKQALLTMFQHVAFSGDDPTGRTYYNDLYDALYPAIVVTKVTLNTNSLSFGSLNSTQQLTATTTPSGGAITWSSSNTSVATVSATGLVTAVGYGNATITATSGGKSATCAVTIAQATVTSISAVYTQSGTVYDSASLDDLKSDLVVTANWSNGTSSTVASADYTLSGTLAVGTSTVTVSYGGQSTTFNVTVVADPTIRYSFDIIEGEYYPTASGASATAGSNCSRTAMVYVNGATEVHVPDPPANSTNKTFVKFMNMESTTTSTKGSGITEATTISFIEGTTGMCFGLSIFGAQSADLLRTWVSGVYGTKNGVVEGWSDGVAYENLELLSGYVQPLNTPYIKGSATWKRTKFIDCHGASKITFPQFTGSDTKYNAFFTKDKVRISWFNLPTAGGDVTVPEDAYYFMCSGDAAPMEALVQLQIVPHGSE